jgi:hypothetical protein
MQKLVRASTIVRDQTDLELETLEQIEEEK